jgi:arabinofuranosyltransferase
VPRHLLFLLVIGLSVVGVTAVYFLPFTAEDAFITYRYAANLATRGALVFNEGEPILALTSPLHGLLTALSVRIGGSPVIANKVMGPLLLAAVAALLWARFRGSPHVQLLIVALVLLPPPVLLWTFGGLETALLLFLVTICVLIADGSGRIAPARLGAVLIVASLAFLTRYDSVLFTAPIVLYALTRAASLRHAAMAIVLGALLPLTWLAISSGFYGDIFPTSYYAKKPQHSLPVLIGNGKYVLSWLVFVGIIPVFVIAATMLGTARPGGAVWLQHGRRYWWLYCGLGAQLAYGLTMATTHMMFSFRFFVPYIPAAALLLGELTRGALELPRSASARRRTHAAVAAAIALLITFQALQAAYTYTRSVNGLARVLRHVEYGSLGVADYTTFIRTLRREGENIRRHWASLQRRPDRLPRIYTYAGGVVPFTVRDSYVYETLVSYRHCPEPDGLVRAPNVWMRTAVDLRASADYIHLLTPRHGDVEGQLPHGMDRFELISSYEVRFDGNRERFQVYFNPSPKEHRLVSRISEQCAAGSAR